MTCLKSSKEDLGLVIRETELCKILQVTKLWSKTCLALLLLQSKEAVYVTYISKPISEKYIAFLQREKEPYCYESLIHFPSQESIIYGISKE